jgi:hypothetical protein
MNADGVNIRMPSTANFLIDSDNGQSPVTFLPDAANFTIKKSAALLNGYFTRLAVTEVVMDWNEPNISAALGNNTITLTLTSGPTPVTSTLPDGSYTVADVLNRIVTDCSGVITGLNVSGVGANCRLASTGAFSVTLGVNDLATQLGISIASSTSHTLNPGLNRIRYLDITSNDLTYNQELKDASTGSIVGDILARWYMSWDNPPPLDQYGFNIEMGYKPFICRRPFAFPKQIKWNNNQPVGNITFRMYANGQTTPYVVVSPIGTKWMMTLLVSEV